MRREALLNSSEEYQKILQVVQMYALDRAGRCSFSLSRRRDRIDVQSSLSDSHVNVVKSLWGDEIGAALLPFTIDEDAKLGLEAGNRGWATRTTFHKLKSAIVIIFLNGRLIEHVSLRRALLQAFAQHLPTSPPAHPFIYLSLHLRGNRVDVNVHPSKRQVFFLDEEEIIGKVVEAVGRQLLDYQYETQPLRPLLIKTLEEEQRIVGKRREREIIQTSTSTTSNNSAGKMTKISTLYPSQRVLTDHKNHKIDTFLFHASQGEKENSKWISVENKTAAGAVEYNAVSFERKRTNERERECSSPVISGPSRTTLCTNTNENMTTCSSPLIAPPFNNDKEKEKEKVKDTCEEFASSSPLIAAETSFVTASEPSQLSVSFNFSVLSEWISERSNEQLSMLLRPSTVVGLIDSKWVLLQSGTNLLMGEMERLNYEMFFSLLAVESELESSEKEHHFMRKLDVNFRVADAFDDAALVLEAEELIRSQRRFLEDNFGVVFGEVEEGRSLVLKSVPQLIAGQRAPPAAFIPTFLQRLCLVPDYEDKDKRNVVGLRTKLQVMKEVSLLLSMIGVDEWEDWQEYVKHVLVPNYRDLRVKFSMADNFNRLEDEDVTDEFILNTLRPPIQIITNTETLYKSFERC